MQASLEKYHTIHKYGGNRMNNTELHLSYRELAHSFDTTAMGVKKFIESKNMPIPEKNGKSYKILPDMVRSILEERKLLCPKEIIPIVNCKGGVGKTTATHMLSTLHSLFWGSTEGYKTLVIDLDFQGNLTTSFGVSKKVGDHPTIYDAYVNDVSIENCVIKVTDSIDIIPSNSRLSLLDNQMLVDQSPLDKFFRSILSPIRNRYSCLFIDCPPRISSSTTAAILYASTLLLITDLDEFAIDGIDTTFAHVASIEKKYAEQIKCTPKIFINKFDAREKKCFKHATELRQKYEDFILSSFISKSSLIKNSYTDGQLIWQNPKTQQVFSDTIDLYLEIFDPQKEWKKKYQ